jgi:hypothetical protein
MANLVISGDSSGSITLAAPAVSGTTILTLPTTSGTLVTTAGGSTVPFALGSAAAPSITFTGDTNTGMFSPGADTIAFTEGGVESMRITSTGNVGIGTSSPSAKLTVLGTENTIARISGSSVNAADFLFENSSNGNYANIGAMGSTGYGVAGWANSFLIESVSNSTGGLVLSSYNGAMLFQTGTGRAERMRIDTSGNVGIGVTPSAWFAGANVLQIGKASAVYANTGVNQVKLLNNARFDASGNPLYLSTGTAQDYTVDGSGNFIWSSAISGSAGGAVTFLERMRIDSSGNVGIGTSSPAVRLAGTVLSINGTSQSSFELLNAGASAGEFFSTSSGTFVNEHRALPLIFRTNGGTERMRIASSGRVGINSINAIWSQNERLSINAIDAGSIATFAALVGSAQMQIIFLGTGGALAGYIEAGATTTAYITSSDYRLKENIAPMTGALATIAQLKPCSYTWKETGESGQGFIAHELQEVVPECVRGEKDAVMEDGSIKPQGIDTSFLVATLTAAIQELNAKVTALEKQLGAK